VPPGAIPTDGSAAICNNYIPATTVLDRFLYVVNVFARNSFAIVIGEGVDTTKHGRKDLPPQEVLDANASLASCHLEPPVRGHALSVNLCEVLADNHLNTDDTFVNNTAQWNTVRTAPTLVLLP
jgi:hypothetical protein